MSLQLHTRRTDSGLYKATFAWLEVPFDVQEAAFIANRLDIVSPAELGFLRANVGDNTFNQYSSTRGRSIHDNRDDGRGFVVFPEGLGTLVGTADIVAARRNNKKYGIPKGQEDLFYDIIDTAIRNGNAVRVGYDKTDVPTNKFGEEEVTSLLYTEPSLGASAQDYGNHIAGKGIEVQSFFFDGKDYAMKNGLYVTVLRLSDSGGGFDVGGNNWGLELGLCAFGVRLRIAEGETQKI